MSYCIGLMSGTSVDGIDAVLLKIKNKVEESSVIAHVFSSFPGNLDQEILELQRHPYCSLKLLGELDYRLGCCYAHTVKKLLKKSDIAACNIVAIGNPGQTIYHYPKKDHPFSLQLGNPNVIVEKLGIPVVSDFRRMDMAYGGDGAPLAPLLHQALFMSAKEVRAIVNLGGIANSTILDIEKEVIGFDHGPANCLMDLWVHLYDKKKRFDDKGRWASKGKICYELLDQMLCDSYFKLTPPKSTGRERFNIQWIQQHVKNFPSLCSQDIQTTLCELTAKIISNDILNYAPKTKSIYLCGGGANNTYLIERLKDHLPYHLILTTDVLGIPVEQVEAVAFAWLAYCRMEKIAGNIPSVTGAKKKALLGGVYLPYPYTQ